MIIYDGHEGGSEKAICYTSDRNFMILPLFIDILSTTEPLVKSFAGYTIISFVAIE